MSPVVRSAFCGFACVAVLSAAVAFQKPPSPNDPLKERIPAVRDGSPRYWKGNLHTHSLWSDGDDFPEMIADWYKRNGYDFLALTEHNVIAEGEKWVPADANDTRATAVKKYRARFGEEWVQQRTLFGKPSIRLKPQSEYRSLLEEAGKFLLVPAQEITHKYAKAPVHINAINLRDAMKPLDGGSVSETIDVNFRQVADLRKKGWKTIAVLNHPNFGWGVRAEDFVLTEKLRFFEVFNGHPTVRNAGDAVHASCEQMWDIVLALRLGRHELSVVYGLATDDAHGYHSWGVGKVNPGRGWVMVRAPHLTSEAIVTAMEAGDFYSSTGVVLDEVRRDGNDLKLTIRGEEGVKYVTEFIATMASVSFDSEPRRGDDGKDLGVTRTYSADIGKVVARVEGLTPAYTLTGKELYVRAKVTSTKLHPNPYAAGDTEVAWTQPVRP